MAKHASVYYTHTHLKHRAQLLTCRRANEHQGDATSPALHHKGHVARWDVRGLLGMVSARSHVVDAVQLNLAQEHDLQSK